MEDIQSLSDEELVNKLKEHGQQTGPITASTRIIFEQKLCRCLGPSAPAPLAESEDIIAVSSKPSSTSEEESRKKPVTESAAKECIFYGIQLPPGANGGQDRLLVFNDKQEALRQLKLFPGSRFKPFSNKQEAENFSRGLSDPSTRTSPKPFLNHVNTNSGPSPSKQVPVESSAFRSVKTQDLVKLRKLLEKGDTFEAQHLIWSNPRYLISSGDTPTVLQEGFRYNALHVAAMKNQPQSAQLILDTIENPQFMQLLYPGEPEQTRDSRIQFLVDLYLNTPDKGLGESALHFACKFGHADVVKILAMHPKTERNRKNKYGETPADVICSRSRQPAGPELKSKIKELLQDHYYVHLWRSEDNSTPPHVAEPWSPTADVTPAVASPGNLASPLTPVINRTTIPGSPRESPVSVKAVAGPMSATQAKKFRKTWLTPPCSSPQERKHIADVKRRDSDKGLERIGRHVAHTLGIPWAEYWDFLGCYADFSTDEGLEKLEIYLRERRDCLQRQQMLENDLNVVSAKLNQLNLSSPGYQSLGVTGKPVIGLDGGGGDTLILYLDKNVLAESGEDKRGGGDVACAKTECGSNDRITQASHPLSSTDGSDKNTEDDKKADLVVNMNRDFWHAHDIPLIDDSDSDNGSDSFHTAFDQAESDVESLFTPPESPPGEQEAPKYFIYGSEPSKTDLDVVRSLEEAVVDENRYPCITEWRKYVKSYKEEDASRWGTPYHIRAAAQYRITASANNTPYSPLLMSRSPGVLSQSFSSSPASSDTESSLDSTATVRVNLMSSFQAEKHTL